MRGVRLVGALSIVAVSVACDSKAITFPACQAAPVHPLEITVEDSVSREVVPRATVIITSASGGYKLYDSTDVAVPFAYQAFYGGAGTYSITIRATGYAPWARTVVVPNTKSALGCSVPATQSVVALLQHIA